MIYLPAITIRSFNQGIRYGNIDKTRNRFITRAHVALLIWTFTARLNFFLRRGFSRAELVLIGRYAWRNSADYAS